MFLFQAFNKLDFPRVNGADSIPFMATTDPSVWTFAPELWLERISTTRWLPWAATAAALVLLAYGLAQWTWRLLEPPTLAAPAKPPTSSVATFDPQLVVGAHLFGQPPSAGAAATDPSRVPLSSLNIVLTGVMARGALSFAFLSVNGAPEAPLVIGQEVTAGAVLETVHSDRILLRRGAALESVLLKDSDVALPAGSIGTAPRIDAAGAVRSLGAGSYSVDRQALTQSLNAETLSQATVTPGAGGLVVRDVQAGSVFEKLGLRAGDVVRNINGQTVTSLEDVMKAYAQFGLTPSAAPVAVEVSRGGKTEVLQYRMQ
jgi:type II secretion system protein C